MLAFTAPRSQLMYKSCVLSTAFQRISSRPVLCTAGIHRLQCLWWVIILLLSGVFSVTLFQFLGST